MYRDASVGSQSNRLMHVPWNMTALLSVAGSTYPAYPNPCNMILRQWRVYTTRTMSSSTALRKAVILCRIMMTKLVWGIKAQLRL